MGLLPFSLSCTKRCPILLVSFFPYFIGECVGIAHQFVLSTANKMELPIFHFLLWTENEKESLFFKFENEQANHFLCNTARKTELPIHLFVFD